MQIRKITTREVDVIAPNASVRDAAAKMKEVDVGAIPVCDGRSFQVWLRIEILPFVPWPKGAVLKSQRALHSNGNAHGGQRQEFGRVDRSGYAG